MNQLYRKPYDGGLGLGSLTYSDLSGTRFSADYAIPDGRFHLISPRSPKETTVVFDLAMHRTPAGWLNLSDHTS